MTRTPTPTSSFRSAGLAALALAAAAAWLLVAVPSAGASRQEPAHAAAGPSAQPAPAGEGAHAAPQGAGHEAGGAKGEGGHEAESPWGLIGKLFNFAVLAGGLVYLLRSPFGAYLRNRGAGIRSDLARAKEMREEATEQVAKIEERLEALPWESRR